MSGASRIPEVPPARASAWRAQIGLIARLAAVAAILWWVIERNGRGRILGALLAADWRWMAVAGLVCFLSIVLGAYQWNLLLRMQGIPYGFRASFRSYYAGMFLNNFLPGTVGGDALRVWDIHRTERSLAKATASTLIDRLLGFSALSAFSLVALAFEFQQRDLPRDLLRRMMETVGFVTLAFGAALALLLSRRFSGALHAAIQSLGLDRLGAAHARIQDALMAYKARWRDMGYVFLVACVVQFLRVTVHILCAWALHLSLQPAFFFSFIPLIALTAVLPLNVGGWGVPQGLGAYLYGLPGVLAVGAAAGADPRAAAAALAFLPTVVGMVVMLGGGFYLVFRPSHNNRRNAS